jgi:hypothetical protein
MPIGIDARNGNPIGIGTPIGYTVGLEEENPIDVEHLSD